MKVNHFPGMADTLARKARLAKCLSRAQRNFPKEYSFFPKTWVLPDEWPDLRRHFMEGERKLPLIVKPDTGCQGKGIVLTRRLADIEAIDAETPITTTNQYVVQKYIMRPYLIDGYKNDLRLYVLVTSVKPLRVFLFHDGLVRLCTSQYVAPAEEGCDLEDACAHLTNYAINKNSDAFEAPAETGGEDADSGSKRSIKWLLRHVTETEGESVAKKLWRKMGRLVAKLLLAVAPTIDAEGNAQLAKDLSGGAFFAGGRQRCFEVLGVDVMLDAKLKPWLLEVNHLPSFRCDAGLDADIKGALLRQTLGYVGADLSAQDRRRYEQLASKHRAVERARIEERRGRLGPEERREANMPDAQGASDLQERAEACLTDFDRVWPLDDGASKAFEAQYEKVLSSMAAAHSRLFAPDQTKPVEKPLEKPPRPFAPAKPLEKPPRPPSDKPPRPPSEKPPRCRTARPRAAPLPPLATRSRSAPTTCAVGRARVALTSAKILMPLAPKDMVFEL